MPPTVKVPWVTRKHVKHRWWVPQPSQAYKKRKRRCAIQHVSARAQEEADLSAGWSCIDALLENLSHARAMRLEIGHLARVEAETRATVGMVWDRMLLNQDVAVRYYRGAMAVALQLKPRPEGEEWFVALQKRMGEIQNKVRRGTQIALALYMSEVLERTCDD